MNSQPEWNLRLPSEGLSSKGWTKLDKAPASSPFLAFSFLTSARVSHLGLCMWFKDLVCVCAHAHTHDMYSSACRGQTRASDPAAGVRGRCELPGRHGC